MQTSSPAAPDMAFHRRDFLRPRDALFREDRGQMMPGGIEAGWEVTPETMAGA